MFRYKLKLIVLLLLLCLQCQMSESVRQLKFVYVTFRSGEHHPAKYTILPEKYPINTEKANTLTDEGKNQMYKLGKIVREFYFEKMCPIRRITSTVTGAADPKMIHSAMLAYAGLMGKPKENHLKKDFNLTQSKAHYYNNTIAYVYQHPWVNCREYTAVLDKAMKQERKTWASGCKHKTKKGKEEKYCKLFRTLRDYYGNAADMPMKTWLIYEALSLQIKYDRALKSEQKELKKISGNLALLKLLSEKFMRAIYSTHELKRFGAGQLYSHIIKDIDRMKHHHYPKNALITMYAGGALDVAAQFAVFGGKNGYVTKSRLPNHGRIKRPGFGAMHIIEVYEENNQWSLRFLYKDDNSTKLSEDLHVLKVKGCNNQYCPVDKINSTAISGDIYVSNSKYEEMCKNPVIKR